MTTDEKQIYDLAAKHAWTPCKHFKQCLGFCPICLWEFFKKREKNGN